MKQGLLALLLLVSASTTKLSAQRLTVEVYQVTVVTRTGDRVRGTLDDVTPNALYCDQREAYNSTSPGRVIPLDIIQKVVVRRTKKRLAVRAGAIVGGILFGILAVQGLERNPTSSAISYGLTVALTSGAGAAIGAGAGSLVGSLSRRVIRPRNRENSLYDFQRQLEPFSVRYQNDVFNRVNQ